jgi:hypothetical protein
MSFLFRACAIAWPRFFCASRLMLLIHLSTGKILRAWNEQSDSWISRRFTPPRALRIEALFWLLALAAWSFRSLCGWQIPLPPAGANGLFARPQNRCHLPCVFQFESSICQPAPRHKLDRVRKATIRLHNNDKPSFLGEQVIDLDSCERKQAHADRQNNPRPGKIILCCDVEIILKALDHGSTRSLANTRRQSSGELRFSKISSAIPAKRSLVITSTRECGKISMIISLTQCLTRKVGFALVLLWFRHPEPLGHCSDLSDAARG